jgi:hypothetical protein
MRMKASTLVRALGELTVIVIGVLIALWAEGWREGLADRASEETHLRALREDLDESLKLLHESNEGFEAMASALNHLLEVDIEATPADSIVAWVDRGLFRLYGYVPRLTALSDLESANQLSLLTPDVRRGIADLRRAVTNLDSYQEDFGISQQGLVDPFIVSRLQVPRIMAQSAGLSMSAERGESDWSLLMSREGRSVLVFKLSLVSLIRQNRAEVLDRFNALAPVIDARLAELGGG